jgi:ATP-binding cassette subfamily F protein 3
MLQASNISKRYGDDIILDGVSFVVNPGERVALIGPNGCGKTTLLRCILGHEQPDGVGHEQPDDGSVILSPPDLRLGYLAQGLEYAPGATISDLLLASQARQRQIEAEVQNLAEAIAAATGEEQAALLDAYASALAELETLGGQTNAHQAQAVLAGLGLADVPLDTSVDILSGGQKTRLGLARVLLSRPHLLLLDEPTNHLDIDGRRWLERFLGEEYRGAVVLVSHDRWLLDRVVTRIVEVERATVREYPGNYHKYHELREQRLVTEHRTYEKQLDRIRREEEFIRRYKAGQRSKQAKGRESRLDRYKRDELVERPAHLDVMNLNLPGAARSGDMVIDGQEVSKRYGDTVLFEALSVSVGRGDRVGIIGPNGVGKTTLVRCLLGELAPDTGAVRLGSRLNPGHYRQRQDDLDLSLPVWRYLQGVIGSLDGRAAASEQQARDLAGAFLFSGGQQDKPLGDLSGGERSRAVLAGLVAGAHNLLVLDEPTNHLDIPSAERLEEALSEYDGTLLLVTHDRALLEATCAQLLVFDGSGGVKLFHGRYSEWAESMQDQVVRERRGSKMPRKAPVKRRAPTAGSAGGGGMSLGTLERRIEALDRAIGQIDQELLDPAVYTDGPKCNALQAKRAKLTDELAPLEDEWARRAEEA